MPQDDIYVGGGPGRHLKQPNPPVKPKWDTDPPEAEEPSPNTQAQSGVYMSPRIVRFPSIPEDTPGTPSIAPAPTGDFTGMTGIKRRPQVK